MKGRVRTNESCPKCGGAFRSLFHPLTNDQVDLLCPDCHTRPRLHYIDARAFRAGKLYRDTRGVLLDSFLAAHRQLEEMRRQDDARTFDPSRYATAKLKLLRVAAEADRWVSRCGRDCSPSYARTAKHLMENHFVPMLGDVDVRDVRRSHLDDFRAVLVDKGLKPYSVKSYLGHISAFFTWLAERETIPSAPRCPAVSVPHQERGWINRKGQEEILRRIARRHRLLFELLIETGCRPGEICGLKVKDLCGEGEILIERSIDMEGNVRGTKTGRVWYKSVRAELYERLEEHAKNRFGEDWLFKNRYELPYRTGGLWGIWKKAAIEAKLPISLYPGTRHSRASQKRRELERRMGEELAQELGHTRAATTMRHYARDRREEMSVECPSDPADGGNAAK